MKFKTNNYKFDGIGNFFAKSVIVVQANGIKSILKTLNLNAELDWDRNLSTVDGMTENPFLTTVSFKKRNFLVSIFEKHKYPSSTRANQI